MFQKILIFLQIIAKNGRKSVNTIEPEAKSFLKQEKALLSKTEVRITIRILEGTNDKQKSSLVVELSRDGELFITSSR